MSALVTVVIPAYNAAPYIQAALESCSAQTHTNLEIIVVDDGSDDETVSLARQHLGVQLIEQANGGPALARNTGVRAANGEFIAFLDADDLLNPDCIEARLAMLESRPEVGMVIGSFGTIDEAGNRTGERKERRPPPIIIGLKEMLSGDWCTSIDGMIVRREAFDRAGYFDPLMRKGCEDWDFEVRVAATMGAIYDPVVRSLYRQVSGSLSRAPLHMYDGMQMLFRKSRIFKRGLSTWWTIARARLNVTGALIFHRAIKEQGVNGVWFILVNRPSLMPLFAVWLGRAGINRLLRAARA